MRNVFNEVKRKIEEKVRYPVLLAEFHFPGNQIEVLSDVDFRHGHFGTIHPIVESWGTLQNNSELRFALGGGALEARRMTIKVINTEDNRFSRMFREYGLENIKVALYMILGERSPLGIVFYNSHVTLVDVFVCRPPIEIDQKTSIISIDLVSPITMSNPYIAGDRNGKQLRYPLVVGHAKQVPLIDLKTNRWTNTNQDFKATHTGKINVRNAVGFAIAGKLLIDNEIVEYSTHDDTSFTLTGRGRDGTTARPHSQGAAISIPGVNYDYAVATGPVAKIDNLIADGESKYLHNYTTLVGNDPAVVRFKDRPPWLVSGTGTSGGTIIQPVETEIFRPGRAGYSKIDPGGLNRGSRVISVNSVLTDSGTCQAYIVGNLDGGDKHVLNNVVSSDVRTSSNMTKAGSYYLSVSNPSDPGGSDQSWAHLGKRGFRPSNTQGSTLKGATCTITLSRAYVQNASSIKCRIGIKKPDGTTTYLQSWDIHQYKTQLIAPAWNNFSTSVDVFTFCKDWSSLLAFEMFVEIKFNGRHTSSASTSHSTVASYKFTFDYYTPPSVLHEPGYSININDIFLPSNVSTSNFKKLQVEVAFSTSISNATELSREIKSGPRGHAVSIFADTVDRTQSRRVFRVDVPGVSSWSDAVRTQTLIEAKIIGPTDGGAARSAILQVEYVKYYISFQDNPITLPDEEVVVYAESMAADVYGVVGGDATKKNITPPDLVHWLLDNHGFSEYLAGYTGESNFYKNEGYFFNGLIPVKTRLHDMIKDALRQGLMRMNYNLGVMRVIPYSPLNSGHMKFEGDDIQLRSFHKDKGNVDLVVNNVEIGYDYDHSTGEPQKLKKATNPDSISRFGIKDFVENYSLINDDKTAQKLIDTIIKKYSKPINLVTFSVFLKGFTLEKEDGVSFDTDFEDITKGSGNVFSKNYNWYQGKTGKITTIDLILKDVKSFYKKPVWLERLIIKDELILKGATRLNLKESLVLNDGAFAIVTEEGYGTNGYGNENPYGD